ncbi:endonuclease/exonuclease/phosphatase family protein [Parasalinivibrio latis]|uniref:endonuclease/exonuclease/phosphatase family protein n=1 Tax=Parasalinivibrio latis TaxID=2952610 RepID=UPI0030E19402
MKKKTAGILAGVLATTLAGAGITLDQVFNIPNEDLVVTSAHSYTQCVKRDSSGVLDKNGVINLAVWNIYKQQKEGWEQALSGLSAANDLLLLQEASYTPELANFIHNHKLHADQVYAFAVLDKVAGVMTASGVSSAGSCAYRAMEPLLRLPKSALASYYRLSDGQVLTVLNVHGVNFTPTLDSYIAQLNTLKWAMEQASGPVIVAGDFNTWSAGRQKALDAFVRALALKSVTPNPDNRLRVFGRPLDHIYYRGLSLEKAKAPGTDASDHSMITATFKLQQ